MPSWLRLVLMAGGVMLFEVIYLFVTQNLSPMGIMQWLRDAFDRLFG